MFFELLHKDRNDYPGPGIRVSHGLFLTLLALSFFLGISFAALFRGFARQALMANKTSSENVQQLSTFPASSTEELSAYNTVIMASPSSSLPLHKTLYEPWLSALKQAAKLGHMEEVLAIAASASQAVPVSSVPVIFRIQALIQLGRHNEALRDIQDALKKFQADPDILITAASFYQATKNQLAAEKMLMQAITIDRKNEGAWRGLVATYFQAGLWRIAVDVASTALEVFPEAPSMILARADASRMLGDWSAAITGYRHYLSLSKSADADACFHLALCLRHSGMNQEELVPYYQKVLDIQANHAPALNDYAMLLASTGRPDEAVALLPRLLQTTGENASALNTAGLVFLKAGRLKDAESMLIRAQALRLDSPQFSAHLAALYLNKNDSIKAENWKTQALAQCKGDQALMEKVLYEIETSR